MNNGYAFSIKYTINKEHASHQFIIEYLKMRSFNGQAIDLEKKELSNQYTELTFPNIAYRIEF